MEFKHSKRDKNFQHNKLEERRFKSNRLFIRAYFSNLSIGIHKTILVVLLILTSFNVCKKDKHLPFNPQPDRSRSLVKVETTEGIILGEQIDSDLQTFLGIPFAEPPVGDMRFSSPKSKKKWNNIKPTYLFGPTCPQKLSEFESASLLHQEEDCLTLNVWTPLADKKARPVIAYIHGGGFILGGSGDPVYNGSNLAKQGDVVVVSFNYRVNVLGGLYLDGFGEEFTGSGNLGLQDQIEALKWIQRNISKFGGDPNNVTIAGESAGSAYVMLMMTSPKAKGLFHKAIAQSGGVNLSRSKAQAVDDTQRFLTLAGISKIEELRKLSIEQISELSNQLLSDAGFESDLVFAPVRDGVFIPEDPLLAFASGVAEGIPLLNGTTNDEYRYWLNFFSSLKYVPPSVLLRFAPRTAGILGNNKDKILDYYENNNPDPRIGGVTFRMVTDLMFRYPHLQVSDLQSLHAPVWMYRFDWNSHVSDDLGACHAIELPFVFGNFESPTAKQIVGPNPPMNLSNEMMQAWISFAKNGNPNHSQLSHWPSYKTNDRYTMIFNEKSESQNDPNGEVRKLYEGIRY